MVKVSPVYLIAGAAVLGAVVWAMTRQASARGVAGAVAGAVIGAADGVVGETVNTIGDVIGIPRTEPTRCEAAKSANNLWEVSQYCTPGDYFRQIPKSIGALFD